MNRDLGMAASWYAATANLAPPRPQLAGDARADLVVVGGGATGLSAALHAAKAGLSVVLLEGGRIGWGASGRNGGQIIPGLRLGAAELAKQFGTERGRALFELAVSARELVVALIARHGIACDLRLTGHLLGAVKASQVGEFEAEVRALEAFGYADARVLGRDEVRAEVATGYLGGLLDARGGHFHTLNYTLGLADAAERAGARLYEHAAVTALNRAGGGVVARTAAGSVTAARAILAGDALLAGLMPAANRRIMPVANYLVATEPLDAAALIPNDRAVSDARFVVNYFRRTADDRLLFGGGERYTRQPPADIAGFVRPFVERTFPQLAGVRFDHGWGGLVSITTSRLPHLAEDGPVLVAHGYSGQGAVMSTLGGKLMADAITRNDRSDWDLFAGIAPLPWPGGRLARGPLHVLGMLWYALRDRLP